MSAARKLLTNRTCLARPSRPRSRVPTTLSRALQLLGLDVPPRLLCPRRPRALPRVWASPWRPAWRAGPVASSLLSLAFSFFILSRVAFLSTGLPDSLLFARIRPRSTTAQSVAFVYRVFFLTGVRGSLCINLVSLEPVASLVLVLHPHPHPIPESIGRSCPAWLGYLFL